MKRAPFGAVVDTHARRILLMSGSGRAEVEIVAKLEELAARLRELAPSNTFVVHRDSEYVAIASPMATEKLQKLLREAALTCGCELR